MALGYQCSWHRVGAFGSGLFIATKGKHNSLRFEATRAKARGAEKFITKGALSIEVAEIAGRRTSRLRIVNVHLGAAVNPKDREGDLERVLAFANCDLKPTEGIILCGDFAFDPHDRVEHARLSAPYRHIVEEYGFTDVLPRRKAGDFPTMLVENPWALPEWRGSSIDYIFYRGALFDGCDRATVCLDQPIHSGKGQALYLSDHAAVFAKLVLKG
jgi:endonuclease/exonuclease/phosphatase family metal-dependent hydrolase